MQNKSHQQSLIFHTSHFLLHLHMEILFEFGKKKKISLSHSPFTNTNELALFEQILSRLAATTTTSGNRSALYSPKRICPSQRIHNNHIKFDMKIFSISFIWFDLVWKKRNKYWKVITQVHTYVREKSDESQCGVE